MEIRSTRLLVDGDASIPSDGHELPLFSMDASEVAQRNFYRPRYAPDGGPIWSPAGLENVGLLVPSRSDDERDARETVTVRSTGGTASAVVASRSTRFSSRATTAS